MYENSRFLFSGSQIKLLIVALVASWNMMLKQLHERQYAEFDCTILPIP